MKPVPQQFNNMFAKHQNRNPGEYIILSTNEKGETVVDCRLLSAHSALFYGYLIEKHINQVVDGELNKTNTRVKPEESEGEVLI